MESDITEETENTMTISTENPQMPESFKVAVNQWEKGVWKGKKFITVKMDMPNGSFELLLWPNEANCLMDMLKNSLKGLDLSYDAKSAYKDLVKAGEAEPIDDMDLDD